MEWEVGCIWIEHSKAFVDALIQRFTGERWFEGIEVFIQPDRHGRSTFNSIILNSEVQIPSEKQKQMMEFLIGWGEGVRYAFKLRI